MIRFKYEQHGVDRRFGFREAEAPAFRRLIVADSAEFRPD